MSLFGSPPDDASPMAAATTAKRSSLFADDATVNGSSTSTSPWSSPTPKRTARRDLVKGLLPTSDVPDGYVDAFDVLQQADESSGGGVSFDTAKKLVESSGLGAGEQNTVLDLVLPAGQDATGELGRGEFNVLLALVGLAEEGEDPLSLDAVDERRKRLPRPDLPFVDKLKSRVSTNGSMTPRSNSQRFMRRGTLDDAESDPWASPDLHRGHNHATMNGDGPMVNGFSSHGSSGVNGSANNTMAGFDGHADSHNGRPGQGQSGDEPPGSSGAGWGDGYGSQGGGGFNSGQSGLGGGFGQSGDDQGGDQQNNLSRSLGGGTINSQRIDDVITIHMLPEKEGMFMFQHRNYEVKSVRRGSSVIRRYSDFVWLVDCLQKRYPFRQIPLLPPKRIGVNGTHLAADSNSFLEKRRRGLVRFSNALVHHPILNQEQLVIMFLTVPTELAVWRKQATISVQEEFADKSLPPELEDSLPSDLDETFETVHSGVRRSADIYINLCNLLDRLAKRNQGLAADQFRVSRALQALTESTSDTYAVDTNDVPLLNNGINSTAKHLNASQGLLEDEARGWDDGILEDMKTLRDCIVAMRDLFDRKDRYARDNIPQLERRIETNEQKLQDLRTRPEGSVKPGEAEKVESAIVKDKESIVQQHARGVLIKECVRDELLIFQRSQYRVSKLHQDWSQERVKYAELQADNWRSLAEEVEPMPTSE